MRWDDIVELDDAKRLLHEAVVMPIKYPQLFQGLLAPWCGILLYGPPGTGKTMLAKAVASECRTTFFNISASSIVSKYRGDSEKLVRVLFELARYHAPSTIFIDEIDSIMGQRGGDGGGSGAEHEGSRRMKTEVLIQMDGLAKAQNPDALVFVLCASNLPWELDVAMLRRLEKRVLVPLPNEKARAAMLERFLAPSVPGGSAAPALDLSLASIAAQSDGFSGADLRLLAKVRQRPRGGMIHILLTASAAHILLCFSQESAMRPVRRLMSQLEELEAASGGDRLSDEQVQGLIQTDPINAGDVEAALSVTRPSAKLFADRYTTWEAEYGAV